MAHDSEQNNEWGPIIESMTVDATEDRPKLKLVLDDGTVLVWTQETLHRAAHALMDYEILFDDLQLDRIHHQRNEASDA